jgi:hypothetical protein
MTDKIINYEMAPKKREWLIKILFGPKEEPVVITPKPAVKETKEHEKGKK